MEPRTESRPRTSWIRRLVKRLLWTSLVVVVLFAIFVTWALTTCFAEPPTLASDPPIFDAKITRDANGRAHLGDSWFEQRKGRSLLHLSGDPFTIGYTNSQLTAELLEQQERSLFETVRTFLPGTISLYGAALLVLVHNRNLPDYVPEEYRMEIFGLSQNRADPYPEFGSRYHRILNYHAAHDISHWIMDTPALGCTSFAAGGKRTRDGHLIVGRNFDWESGEHFDVNKVIALYRPTQGRTFLSVSWPGMAGAVTGLNDAKIFCSINGAHTEHMGLGVGRPVSIVVRQVLQYAEDLDSAATLIMESPVFVADSFLVADGKTGEAIVVEKTPKTGAVRRMTDDWILQSNHFESAALAEDRGNLEYMRDGTSVARRERLAELLAQHSGRLDPATAVAVLRDRRGPGGADRGLGHRATINPMIATHSVVADLTAGVLWVSRGRHQLGAFDAYTIAGFGTPAAEPIPADPALTDGDYDRLTRYREILSTLQPALRSNGPLDREAMQQLTAAAALNPLAPEIRTWLGDAYRRAGEFDKALAEYRAADRAGAPFAPDRQRVRDAVRSLEERAK